MRLRDGNGSLSRECTRGLRTVKWVSGMLILIVVCILCQGEHFKFLVWRVGVVERKGWELCACLKP